MTVTNSAPSSSNSLTQPGFFGSGSGGGIDDAGTLTVTDSTLSDNTATGGGGIDISGPGTRPVTATVTASLFANPAGGNLVLGAGASFASRGHNLFSDAPAVALDPTDLINTDPLLAPLGNYGGPTETQALLPGSPAIDAGIAVAGVTTDQRGIPRPQGTAPDIGAFESRGFTLAAVGGNNQSTPAGSAFAAPLMVTVASPFGEPVAGGRVTFSAPTTGASASFAGNPAPIGPDGRASATATANTVPGASAVTAPARGAPGAAGFILSNAVQNPSLSLAAPPGAGTVGQSQTVMATLKNGNGTPLPGIPVTFQVTAGPNAGATGTTNPANGLTDANGQVTFTYVGNGAGTDTIVATATTLGLSSATTVTWTAPPAPPPPTVASVQRLGVHQQPTQLLIFFNGPLDPTQAEDTSNYTLTTTGRRPRAIAIDRALYDPTTRSVTLLPHERLSLTQAYQLTVHGGGPHGTDFTTRIYGGGFLAGLGFPAPDGGGPGRGGGLVELAFGELRCRRTGGRRQGA